MDTAIEKPADRTPDVITTPEEFRSSMLRWQGNRMNVLTPFSHISGMAASHGIRATVITINPSSASGQVYTGLPFLKKDEAALAKLGLRAIAEGLGISIKLEYISSGETTRHFYHVKAIASYKGIDGAAVNREASEVWDLRDGSERMKGWTPNQISEGRKHGIRNCETRAINAAIRECGAGIKQAYTLAELERPFVAVRVSYEPDLNDPETRRQLTEKHLGGQAALYGHTSAAPPVHDGDVFDEPSAAAAGVPRQVGSGSTVTKPRADEPPTKDAVRIVKVTDHAGETNGHKWTRCVIIDTAGVEHSTFDKKIAAAAREHEKSKAWVEIVSEQHGEYANVTEITLAVADGKPTAPATVPDQF